MCKGEKIMCKKCNADQKDLSLEELRQQLAYARTISGDLFNLFAVKSPENVLLACEYETVETKLSMLLDFLFQAKLWCDVVSKEDI